MSIFKFPLLKFLVACAAAFAVAGAPAAHAAADTSKPKAEAKKKPAAKAGKSTTKAKKPVAPVAPAEPDPEADEPDIAGTTTVDFDCELGNKITIYQNAGDDGHIALRWKKRLHRLARVATTTGAQRFENKLYGLIWIGIPAKGMLLDSKLNRQLANECRNAEQMNPPAAPVVTAAKLVPEAPAAAPQAPTQL